MIVLSRDEWSARKKQGGPVPVQLGLVVVHHFWKPHVDAGVPLSREVDIMQGVQRFHVEDQGWADIGYNWIIFQSGHVYEGRGWGRAGAHTKGQNSKSVGICFAINGDEFYLTPAAIEACRELLAEGVELGFIARNFQIKGHRDYAEKSCPGRLVYPILDSLRPDHDKRDPVRAD